MLAGPFIPTAPGSNHGLTPVATYSGNHGNPLHNVQYPQHHSSPDIYTYDYSAPSTIFTPGGSLVKESYLFRGSDLSTVTQDEPVVGCFSVDEEMTLYSRKLLLNIG